MIYSYRALLKSLLADHSSQSKDNTIIQDQRRRFRPPKQTTPIITKPNNNNKLSFKIVKVTC
eukprot:1189912-Prorocentrum_minimum.AAC.2